MMPAPTTDTAAIRRVLAALGAPGANWHALVIQALDASMAHTGAQAAAIFTPGAADPGDGGPGGKGAAVDLVALRGEGALPSDPWLRAAAKAIGTVLRQRDTAVVPADDTEAPSRYIVMAPIPLRDGSVAVLALLTRDDDRIAAEEHRERALLAAATLTAADLRSAADARAAELGQLGSAIGVVRSAGDADRFKESAIALCNTLATTFGCDRVSLAWVRAHQSRIIAMSHADKIVRRLPLLRDIEAAMEESLDQDEDVLFPAPPGSRTIARAAEHLATRHGPLSVATLPLRAGKGGASLVGAITLERSADTPWTPAALAPVRLIADLASPMLSHHKKDDAWLGAKLLDSARRSAGAVLGPRHTIAKLISALCVAALAALVFVRIDHTVPASFVLEAPGQRVIAAPFDAVLTEAPLRAGDAIEAGVTVLARLDTSDLRLEAAAIRADRAGEERQASSARRTGDATSAAIHDALVEEADARLALITSRIEAATLTAPLTGVILSGSPEHLLGARLRQGETLYRVAPGGDMLADVFVPQRHAAKLGEGQRITLASAAFPDRRFAATIDRVSPAAEEREGGRYFRVIARIDEPREWMRSGMEGEARLAVGRRSLLSAWTSDLVDWVRLRLWL